MGMAAGGWRVAKAPSVSAIVDRRRAKPTGGRWPGCSEENCGCFTSPPPIGSPAGRPPGRVPGGGRSPAARDGHSAFAGADGLQPVVYQIPSARAPSASSWQHAIAVPFGRQTGQINRTNRAAYAYLFWVIFHARGTILKGSDGSQCTVQRGRSGERKEDPSCLPTVKSPAIRPSCRSHP
jgi:hypothetical protein